MKKKFECSGVRKMSLRKKGGEKQMWKDGEKPNAM